MSVRQTNLQSTWEVGAESRPMTPVTLSGLTLLAALRMMIIGRMMTSGEGCSALLSFFSRRPKFLQYSPQAQRGSLIAAILSHTNTLKIWARHAHVHGHPDGCVSSMMLCGSL